MRLRALNAQPSALSPREEVYCTKIGTTHPDEMYIVGAHMDGHGWGEAANDDGAGHGIGADSYVAQRAALQGREDTAGSGKYPEPKWLGVIQHDMMLFDHGMPRADGSVCPEQRPEADINIEFQSVAKFSDGAQKLAWLFVAANEAYATNYPAAVGPHMTNTDSTPFMDLVPAISLRENERGREIGAGWDPHWHQPTDCFTSFSDKDFLLGLNAAQTTLGAVARLVGATLAK